MSHRLNELEIVAAGLAIRSEGLHVLTFWEHIAANFGDNIIATSTPESVPDPFASKYSPLRYFIQTQLGGLGHRQD